MSSKNKVTLAIYLKWRKDNVIGKKITEEDRTYGVKYMPNTNQKYSGN